MYGPSTRFTRKPGASFTGSGSLSIWRTNAAAFFATSGLVFWEETTSTSCSSGTGLKKWMPTRRDGSFIAVAMSASCRLEVLLARIAPGFATFSRWVNSACFACRFSTIASMMTSAWRGAFAADVGDQAVERVAHAARVAQALVEQLGRALHRRRQALGRDVLQRHRQAAHRAHRRDVAAHHAGADDVHVARLEVRPCPAPSGAPAGRRCGSGWRWWDARTAPRSRRRGRPARRTGRRRTCATARGSRRARGSAPSSRASRPASCACETTTDLKPA